MEEYHKIQTLFKRDEKTKKLIEGEFTDKTVEFIKNLKWQFTEKIDGTNIRIMWDGYRVTFGARTDNGQIPAPLINRLVELFAGEKNEQLFEQKFGKTKVMLVGEGYGNGIQNGGSYRPTQEFILFDIKIAGNWQPRESVENIAKYFGIDAVPVVLEGTIQDGIDFVKTEPYSKIGMAKAEGVVGRPFVEMQDRCGNRLIVKIKVNDFK